MIGNRGLKIVVLSLHGSKSMGRILDMTEQDRCQVLAREQDGSSGRIFFTITAKTGFEWMH
jgi:hypothetical protein